MSEDWLTDVRKHVLKSDLNMLPILNTYEGEARFGRKFIANDLSRIAKGSEVLEVGAGSLLLSCQLVREGYRVTALDPVSIGFSHFERMRKLILERAEALDCLPQIINQTAEELSQRDFFDYAFSINVMEHINDLKMAITNIGMSLRPAASYHFTCPNYLFPHEPHFNIPTLFSKKITAKVFRNKIYNKLGLPDPNGLWRSLNWITVPQIREIVDQMPELNIQFNQLFLVSTLERIVTDSEFASRRSGWARILIMGLIKLRLIGIAGRIPVTMQPVIDCTLTRKGN